MKGGEIDGIEIGIAFSVLALGTAIAFSGTLSARVVYAFVAFFGLCHGYAHGAEMPKQADPSLFVLGFMMATIAVHLAGVSVGLFTTRITSNGEYLRFAGGMIAGMGLSFLNREYGII